MSGGVRWWAPGRVNLIGEHTDYNDGLVLPFALQLGVTAHASPRDDHTLAVTSSAWPGAQVTVALDDLTPGAPAAVTGWATYVAAVAWALRAAGHELGGADVHLDSDLPVGAGLSSSAAVCCATAGALADLAGADPGADGLIALARAAERDFVGVPVGPLDQNAVVRCRRRHALFLDVRSGRSRHVPLELPAAGLALVVIDTRAPHRLVDGEYARRRQECATACERLGVASLRDLGDTGDLDAALEQLDETVLRRRVRHVVTENARVEQVVAALEGGAPRAVGPALSESHASLRDDYAVSCRELDLAVEASLGAGALGARMTGGGFGGSAIALVEAEAVTTVEAAVTGAFARRGLAPPHAFAVTPAAGAHRV